MRGGDLVVYHGVDGRRHQATVTSLSGTGESGFKILDLQLPGGTQVTGIVHESDRTTGSGYWTERDALPESPTPAEQSGHAAFDAAAAAARGGDIANASVADLEDVADAYGFDADAVKGTGSGGAVLKRDWLRELKRRRGT